MDTGNQAVTNRAVVVPGRSGEYSGGRGGGIVWAPDPVVRLGAITWIASQVGKELIRTTVTYRVLPCAECCRSLVSAHFGSYELGALLFLS